MAGNVLEGIIVVFGIIGLGIAAGRLGRVGPDTIKSLTNLLMFIFVPALVFVSALSSSLTGTGAVMMLAAAAVIVVMGMGAFAATGLIRLDKGDRSGFLLTTMFMNTGSMASAICLFTYGPEGFFLAVMFYVIVQCFLYTIGVTIASGSGERPGLKALKSVLALPIIYALALGMAFNFYDVRLPEAALTPVRMLSGAAVPLLLVTMGLQLSLVKVRTENLQVPAASTALRIGLGFVAGLSIAHLLGLGGLVRDVVIICAAMPSQVTTFAIASKFRCVPDQVALTIWLSTGVSLATTPLIIFSLGYL